MTLRVGIRIYPNTQEGRDRVESLLSEQGIEPSVKVVEPDVKPEAKAKKTPKSK